MEWLSESGIAVFSVVRPKYVAEQIRFSVPFNLKNLSFSK